MPLYGKFCANMLGGETAGETIAVDYLSDNIYVALTTSSYTPDQDTHEFWSDITNEVSGTGYASGGTALASKTVTYTGASNKTTLDAADTTWSSSSITARYAIIYKTTGVAASSPLIAYIDFGSNQTSSNGNFTIQWNASGIIEFTAT